MTGDEAQFMLDYLSQNSIKLPANHPTHSKDENVIANLGTIYYSASIKMLDDDTYQIATKTRSFLGILMSLHEAKDNSIFDILAIGFAITLIVLYISGVMITFFVMAKKKRQTQYIAIIAGIATSVIFAGITVFY